MTDSMKTGFLEMRQHLKHLEDLEKLADGLAKSAMQSVALLALISRFSLLLNDAAPSDMFWWEVRDLIRSQMYKSSHAMAFVLMLKSIDERVHQKK